MKPITKVKKWIISEIECTLGSLTYPRLSEVNEKNLDKAIEQSNNECGEKDILKKCKEIYLIIKDW